MRQPEASGRMEVTAVIQGKSSWFKVVVDAVGKSWWDLALDWMWVGEKSGTTSTFGALTTGRMEAGGVISLRWEVMGGGAGLRGASEAQGLGPEFEMPVRPWSRGGEVAVGHESGAAERRSGWRVKCGSAQRRCVKSPGGGPQGTSAGRNEEIPARNQQLPQRRIEQSQRTSQRFFLS